MKTILTVILTLASITPSYAQTRSMLCEVSDLPLTLAPQEIGVVVEGFEAVSRTDGAGVHFTLVNRGTKPILRIRTFVELLSGKSEHLMTIPFSRFFAASPLLPGKSLILTEDVQVTTADCPVRAQASVVDIDFTDGTGYHYAAPQWQIEPRISGAASLRLDHLPKSLPFQDVVDVKIDRKGKVSRVSSHSGDSNIEEWFRTELSEWSFSPLLKNGKAVPSELRLLFRIHKDSDRSDPTHFDDTSFQAGLIVTLDVFPQGNPMKNIQFIDVGGLPLVVPD